MILCIDCAQSYPQYPRRWWNTTRPGICASCGAQRDKTIEVTTHEESAKAAAAKGAKSAQP